VGNQHDTPFHKDLVLYFIEESIDLPVAAKETERFLSYEESGV